MKRFFVAIVILVLLLVFNPSIDAHREAMRPYVDKCMNEAYQKGNWLSKLGLAIGGDDLKAIFFNSVYRKSYGIFSVGYVEDDVVTFGILGYVHVFE